MRCILLLIACLVSSLFIAPSPYALAQQIAAPAAGASAAMPDTPLGRCAGAWLRMVRDGTEADARAFESTYRAPARLAERSIDERVARLQGLRAEFGQLRIDKVTQSSDRQLAVTATGPRGPVLLEFAFDGDGKLDTISITSSTESVPSAPIDGARRGKIVEAMCRALREEYVFPEKGEAMAKAIAATAAAGGYDAIADERALAERLTTDARAVVNDRHLRVRLSPQGPAPQGQELVPSDDEARRENWGFRSCEIVEGNVGVLRFDAFIAHEEAKRVADAALAFLGRCDALIFDLRQNGGGSPEMINHLAGYLFEKPTLLNRMVDRSGAVTGEGSSDAEVSGQRFRADLPVFVVTSARTFSGAEEFAYDLQALGRATVVGETTGGGAHPVRMIRLDDRLAVVMPHLRAQNPVTGTNWEGTGVKPDVEVPAGQAMERAIGLARERVAGARR